MYKALLVKFVKRYLDVNVIYGVLFFDVNLVY